MPDLGWYWIIAGVTAGVVFVCRWDVLNSYGRSFRLWIQDGFTQILVAAVAGALWPITILFTLYKKGRGFLGPLSSNFRR